VIAAAKPVLLLLPGLMCDAAVWRAQALAFETAWDVRIPDFIGLDSFDAMAAAALALTDGPFALAGHSMGGRVAMQVAAMAPERVQRLALLDTAAHLPDPAEPARRQALIDIGAREGIEGVIAAWLPPMIAPDRRSDRALTDAISDMLRRAGVEALKQQASALLNRGDGFAQLDRVRVPTAFIVGALDSWSPPQQHRDMQAHVAGSVLTVIENCGHMAPMEAPNAVIAALQPWLQQE
jgi:pimeloyl-ACP methyl ester carboxylesterase